MTGLNSVQQTLWYAYTVLGAGENEFASKALTSQCGELWASSQVSPLPRDQGAYE